MKQLPEWMRQAADMTTSVTVEHLEHRNTWLILMFDLLSLGGYEVDEEPNDGYLCTTFPKLERIGRRNEQGLLLYTDI